MATRRKPRSSSPSIVSVSKKFGRYKPEEEKTVRKIDLEENKASKRIMEVWERDFRCLRRHRENPDSEGLLIAEDGLIEILKGFRYSPKDVERFSIKLGEFQELPESNDRLFSFMIGSFLNALIKAGKNRRYRLMLQHLSTEIDGLGSGNRKNILIEGGMLESPCFLMESGSVRIKDAVVRGVGRGMAGGSVVIDGDAEEPVGKLMCGGTIIIKGDVISHPWSDEAYIGYRMEGGIIRIEGNAGYGIGHEMTGGEIHIGGDYKNLGDIKHGKIYHKGKLIVDR